MVIRDLTLRSAASFGSFHLIRLLYDEYMFFIVEHKVAEATNTTPIAVMGCPNGMVSLNFFLYKKHIYSGCILLHILNTKCTLVYTNLSIESM